MPQMIFVNLPVTDLPKSKAFYEAVGAVNNPAFTDDTAACMVVAEGSIHVMLLTHEKWKTFTSRPIPAADASEVMLCVSCDSRDDVNHLVEQAAAFGGTADVNPSQDHGFMMSRTFADPDGHVWEPMWMDPAVAQGDAHISETAG